MSAGALFRPPHAYVPGRTPRHPEGLFDPLRDTARPGADPEALARSAAFRAGLHYLATGFYWEAHEVLEPVWMALPAGVERRFVQALIQLANGRLKLAMDRHRAAQRLARIARGLLGDSLKVPQVMGLRPGEVADWVDTLEAEAKGAL